MQPTTESPLAARLAELCITATATLVRKPLVRTYKWSSRDKAQPYDELPYSDPQAKGHDWRESAHQWRVVLSRPVERSHERDYASALPMECDFWTGSAHVTPYKGGPERLIPMGGKPTPPSATDVLSSLLLDSQANEQSFADWCGEFGYDTDSRKAFDVYTACQASGDKLRRFLSADLIAELRNLEH